MPIARLSPDAESPVKVNLPETQSPEYKSIIQYDSRTALKSLLAYVEGAPWTVHYYSQLLAEHNDLKHFDPNQPAQYQQYHKINQLELRVTTPLNSNYSAESGITTVTGSAFVPSCLVPNIGDVFIATVDKTDDAIFSVTLVEKRTHNRNSVFYIEYALKTLVPQHPEWLENLESKVQREYFFNKDRLVDGLDALVTPLRHELIEKGKEAIKNLSKMYFKTFYSPKYATLIVPGQQAVFYDPLLVNFVSKIISTDLAEEIRMMHVLNPDLDPYLAQPTIWDCLLDASTDQLFYINKKMGWVSSQMFTRFPTIEGIRYQRMQYIAYPVDIDTSVKNINVERPRIHSSEELGITTGVKGLVDLIHNQVSVGNTVIQKIPDLFIDQYYIMGPAFYNRTAGMSQLELLVMDYLLRKSTDIEVLMNLIKDYSNWNRLQQFYFTPVILILLRSTVGSVYV